MAVAEMTQATNYNNVGFKYGPQSGLRTVMTEKKVVPGTFYLTSDTNRLYIGKTTELIAPINEGVIKVATVNDLPKDADSKDTGIIGSFYYVEDGNILCVFNGSKWVQINPDTTVTNEDLTVVLGSVTQEVDKNDVVLAEKMSVTTKVTDSEGDAVEGSFILVTEFVDGKKTIELEKGTRGEGDSTLHAVTLTGDTYTLSTSVPKDSSNEVNIDLGSAFEHNSSIKLSSSGSINITSTDSNIELEGFKAVDGSLIDATKANTEGFAITLVDHNGDEATATINPVIVVGQGENAKESTTFTGSEAALPVYSVAEIDSKIANLNTSFDNLIKGYNALEYKGTIGSNDDATHEKLPDGVSEGQKVSIGYAYLASSEVSIDKDTTVPKGTLIIATAGEDVVEDANGYLPSDGIVWTTVTGDTSDTHYAFVGDANLMGVELKDTTNDQSVGSLKIAVTDTTENSGLQISRNSKSTATETTLEIGHKGVTTSAAADGNTAVMEALATNFTFTYVSELVADGYGHITGYKTKTATVKDTTYDFKVDEASITVKEVTGGGVEITPVFSMTNTVTDDTYEPETAEGIALNSSTLDIGVNADKKTVEINLLWETF